MDQSHLKKGGNEKSEQVLHAVNLICDAASHGPFLTDLAGGAGDALQAQVPWPPRAALSADRMAQGQFTRPLAALDTPRAPEDRPVAGHAETTRNITFYFKTSGVSFPGLKADVTQPGSVQVSSWTTVLLPGPAGHRGHHHSCVRCGLHRAPSQCSTQTPRGLLGPAAPISCSSK